MSYQDNRKNEYDVFYEAWRRGLDPDRAVDRYRDHIISGYDKGADAFVNNYEAEIRRQQRQEDAVLEQEEDRRDE